MNRKEFILGGAGAFFIASAGKAFGADAPSNRVRLALVGCREKGLGAAVVQRALQAWKWSGVSERMPSTLESSSILRRSFSFFGRLAPLLFFSTSSAA